MLSHLFLENPCIIYSTIFHFLHQNTAITRDIILVNFTKLHFHKFRLWVPGENILHFYLLKKIFIFYTFYFQSQIIKKLWVECEKHETIAYMWNKVNEENSFVIDVTEIKCFTVKNAEIIEAPMSLPLHLIKVPETSVWFCIVPIKKSCKMKNAFDLIMQKKLLNAEKLKETNKKDCLYNDVVEVILENEIKFRTTPKSLIQSVTECLWLIDCCHGEINAAFAQKKCIQLPTFFEKIYAKQYNMWQEKKKPKPFLSYEKLNSASGKLFDIVSATHGQESQLFVTKCRDLAECLHSYAGYLNKTKIRMEKLRNKTNAEKSESFTLPNVIPPKEHVADPYKILEEQLSENDFFEPMFIQNDMVKVPEDRKQRYKWYEDLAVSQRYSFRHITFF